MSGCSYDLDTSGGLMDQIQALIAPPESESSKKDKKGKTEHPYFRKPGKGHNHDSCDACGEGGDLICCDKCPSSFHLGCHDPPLEDKDIPRGEWLCHSCKYAKKQNGNPQLRKRSNSTPTPGSSGIKPAKKIKLSPMEMLIEAANSMNPKQFELPRSMSFPSILFPGSDKIDMSKVPRRPKLKDHEKQVDGIVPLPAKKCAECRKSCRVAPLLACDYCSCFYHLDCLDPPLTAPPNGLWMCPQHVEHTLDTTMLTSVSVTERVKLWDKFTAPVDQDTIKLEFFRKIHRKNPPFRIKQRLPMRNSVNVPEMVKYHYRKPVNLLPSLKDVLRIENLSRRLSLKDILSKNDEAVIVGDSPDQEKNEEKNTEKAVIEEESDDKKELDFKEENCDISSNISDLTDFSLKVNKIMEEQRKIIQKNNTKTESNGNAQTNHVNITNNTVFANTFINFNCENGFRQELNNGYFEKELMKKENNFIQDLMDSFSNEVEVELRQLDDRLVKILAYQRIQQLLTNSNNPQQNHTSNQINLNFIKEKFPQMPKPSELLTAADIERISRVFASPKKKCKPKSTIRARAMLCPVVSKHFYNVRTNEVDPTDVRHDASFMGFRPTVSTRFPEAVAMRYRVLSVGKGSANDVDLEKFGYCNFIAAKHATIFYDEYSKSYELINYSQHGTYVNNVLYSNDVAIKRPDAVVSTDEKCVNVELQVREIIDKKRKVSRSRKNSVESKMAAVDYSERVECCCTNNFEELKLKNGWEGSAILNHGSLLKFGCINFVFSIVENAA